jgi:hypothetical protein
LRPGVLSGETWRGEILRGETWGWEDKEMGEFEKRGMGIEIRYHLDKHK